MNKPNPEPGMPGVTEPGSVPGDVAPVSQSRRRLIRAGATAVPVVATLMSRPAHAWSCKSPSAWGSLQANPNTSLRNNAGHQSYTDETWTLSNWAGNKARSATGYSAKPWNKLVGKYSGLYTSATKTNNAFDYRKVTVSMLQSVVGIQIPDGTGGGSMACQSMSGFGGCCLAAQLNYIMLSPLTANQIERCLTLVELKQMAVLAYPANASPWSRSQVAAYLTQNYIAVA